MAVYAYEKRYTVEDFWEFARSPENETRRLELEDGVIVEMASSSPLNTVIAGRIIYFLNGHVIPNDLGYVTVPDGGFKLGSKSSRQPDAAFVSKARAPKLPKAFDFAPDLAVEIVSPDEDILKKANEYIRAGTRLVWAVYGIEQTVYVFRPPQGGELRVQILGVGDVLDGEDVLPGFTLKISDIFPE